MTRVLLSFSEQFQNAKILESSRSTLWTTR